MSVVVGAGDGDAGGVGALHALRPHIALRAPGSGIALVAFGPFDVADQ